GTRTTPTRTCASRTCAPRPRSSPWRSLTCSGRGELRGSGGIGRKVVGSNGAHDDASFPPDARPRKQCSLERARDRLFALACPDGIADGDDNLPGLGELPKVVGRSASSLVIEPIAKHRRGKKLGEGRRASGPPVEHPCCDCPDANAVAGASRNHEAVERREHVGLLGDVALEAEFDAVARARGDKVADAALEARLARRDLLE